MKLTKNIIQFQKNLVYLGSETSDQDQQVLALSLTSELMQFGYLPSPEVITHLSQASKTQLIKFHQEVISFLKEITGSSHSFQPFWKGFPEQVMEKSESELWFHQILHYLSVGTYEPNQWTQKRPTAFEQPKYTILNLGSEAQWSQIFIDLVSRNQSLSPVEKETVEFFIQNKENLILPSYIPFKETLCMLAAREVAVPVTNCTDVLRVAVYLSGGDPSLPKVPAPMVYTTAWATRKSENPARELFKFKKFSRKERKFLLNLLEKTTCDPQEAVLKDQRWKRLGEILHPGEYSQQFPKAYQMFQQIRNQKVQSWYGIVDSAFQSSLTEGLQTLAQKPGEFTRRLDHLLRNHPTQESQILQVFSTLTAQTSHKVLFETYQHFAGRNKIVQNRSIMVKGARKRTTLPNLPALNTNTISALQKIIHTCLTENFQKLSPLGKTWIHPDLDKMPLKA